MVAMHFGVLKFSPKEFGAENPYGFFLLGGPGFDSNSCRTIGRNMISIFPLHKKHHKNIGVCLHPQLSFTPP